MPGHLKIKYYDVMVLYAEADRADATIFLRHLCNDIHLKDGSLIEAVLYDGQELSVLSGLKLEQLDMAFSRCSFTFLYLTKHFVEDFWCRISLGSLLMRTMYDQEKNWRVVPVYTMRMSLCDFIIPSGINVLNGIIYYDNDEVYRKSVASLIEKTVSERKLKDLRLIEKRKDWIDNHTDLSQERSLNDVSNDDLPSLDRLEMAEPQQSKNSYIALPDKVQLFGHYC